MDVAARAQMDGNNLLPTSLRREYRESEAAPVCAAALPQMQSFQVKPMPHVNHVVMDGPWKLLLNDGG
jgi:hypothetical protein